MRIGEIKNTLKEVLNQENKIEIRSENLYEGQAYQILNLQALIEALQIISVQEWNEIDFAPIKDIVDQYQGIQKPVMISADEYNRLRSYVDGVNPNIPLYYSVLSSLSEEQSENTINVKLPDRIDSLKSLNELNDRLEKIFLRVNVDGKFEFKGFDKGTEWYVFIAGGVLTYRFLLACLKIAQEYFKTRKEYFESEKAKIAYKVYEKELKKGELSEYQKKYLDVFIEEKIEEAISKIGTNGHTPPELHTKLVKATTDLIKELDSGTEFHLSLNPPAYAREVAGELRIDYQKLQELKPQEETETKQLEAPEETDENNSETKE